MIKKYLKAYFNSRWLRYTFIIVSSLMLLSPLLIVPQMFNNDDLCGGLCLRRFYLYFPGMGWEDVLHNMKVAIIGVIALLIILTVTFFFGRLWCGYLCPMGGLPELISRLFHDRIKIDYRALPQIPIRYGYFLTYVILLPALGISACSLCNFITIPRMIEAMGGGTRGIAFLVSSIGAVNLGLVILLGFFAKYGRGYCAFLCPIGAIDGLVNRIASKLYFVRRVRVQRDRCTGCRECAEVCITGSIKMVDRIAEVDQLSCMSCRDCVVVCDWGAIDWITHPTDEKPKRLRKGVEFTQPPVWVSVTSDHHRKKESQHGHPWLRRILILLLILFLLLIFKVSVASQLTDPDGCLACHGLSNLEFIDKKGLYRSSSIDVDHYSASIHGNVPCSDCHREIKEYPHKVENGAVDCSASCHIEEPSKGEAYTHKPIADEYQKSIHSEGENKNFTAGNRIADDSNQKPPSCRRCHSNTAYIPASKMEEFKEIFKHGDEACGNCHQGKVWKDRISGHILRRLLGKRLSKQDEIKLCNSCHADLEAMQKVERKTQGENKQKIETTPHFVLASKSYDMTLHARLIASGRDAGASCNECHAPEGWHHDIRSEYDPESTTHKDNLEKTCGSSKCHSFVKKSKLNKGFLHTDLHDLDLAMPSKYNPMNKSRLESNWVRASLVLAIPVVLLIIIKLLWSFFVIKRKNLIPFIGGKRFERVFLQRPPRKKKKIAKKGKAK